jgi:predicted aldo/keto reductase-like oxidoreductase
VIETGLFDYVNLHYQWCGSYTASGSGPEGGNGPALLAAHKQDMGVFIISPTDKGGALYEPSKALYKDCLPLTPIAFHDLWLWSHDSIHTLVIGAARPSDFDEHLEAAQRYEQRHELSAPIMARLRQRVTDALGADFFPGWAVGLPDAYESPLGLGVGYLYWLWWITKFWGLHNYAQKRYASLEANLKTWGDAKTEAENKEQFSWVPGLPFRPEQEDQVRAHLLEFGSSAGLSAEKAEHVMTAIKEGHEWLREGGCFARNEPPVGEGIVADDWLVAFNLQPDKPYPERG